ncbi:right-handed parallel beta-helix repeat-containing protein [Myxococcota bacterium]
MKRRESRSDGANSSGIEVAASDVEIDNNEISAWSHVGVAIIEGLTGADVHHNYIHHCQRAGLGYGVSHLFATWRLPKMAPESVC